MKSKYQITKFVDLIDTRKEIRINTILPQEFWQAFEQGIYPPSNQDTLSYHIDDYAKLIKRLGYAHSIYSYEYEINIIAVRGIFFISIFSISNKSRLIGIIDFNQGRKKHEVCYSAKRIDNHPIVTSLLNKLSDELIHKGLKIDERVSGNYTLPFHIPLKSLVCTLQWKQLITNEPNLTPEDRAEIIAKKLKVNPITLAKSYGTYSTDKAVKKEAFVASNHLLDSKYNLTEQWRELLVSAPELTAKERAEYLATKTDLDPVTVAAYLKYSIDDKVRPEANLAFTVLLEAKHDITSQWLELLTEASDLDPRERAEIIATRQGINPVTIAGYGRVSKNKKVKNEAHKAFNNLLDSKHEITEQWRELISSSLELSPKERAESIASKLKIKPSTVASYGKSSLNKKVRNEASQAYSMIMETKHNITSEWLELITNKPALTPTQRAEVIATKKGLDPVTVATYGRASPNPKVKSEAFKAVNILLDSKYEITTKWQNLIENRPKMSPKERAECIAAELHIDAISVSSYGRSSVDKTVKSESNKAFNTIYESRHEITQRWRKLMKTSPHFSPQERAEHIGFEIGIEPTTVTRYGQNSPDKDVKSEAIKASGMLLESRHDITGLWLKLKEKMPTFNPKECAGHLALELGLDPLTIAGYGKFSKNSQIKSEANQAFMALRDASQNITPRWRKLIETCPNLSPQERAEHLASDLDVSPVTVAGCAKYSSDRDVKSDANKAFKKLLESKHSITERWEKLLNDKPEITPQKRAELIAMELGIAPITTAGYGTASSNQQVKSEAYHAFYKIWKLKCNSNKE